MLPPVADLFDQILSASHSEAPRAQRYNPKPAGVIRTGSAAAIVLAFLVESPGLHTEAQIRWKTKLTHSKVSWALLYLRKLKKIDGVEDPVRNERYLRYRAKPEVKDGK